MGASRVRRRLHPLLHALCHGVVRRRRIICSVASPHTRIRLSRHAFQSGHRISLLWTTRYPIDLVATRRPLYRDSSHRRRHISPRVDGHSRRTVQRLYRSRKGPPIDCRSSGRIRISRILRTHPPIGSAIIFAVTAGFVAHFSWRAPVRVGKWIPILSVGVALAHAFMGAVTGRRLLYQARTFAAAFGIGAAISLSALVLFTPPFVDWIAAAGTSPSDPVSFLLFATWVGGFTFLAGWCAIALISGAVATALLASRRPGTDPDR